MALQKFPRSIPDQTGHSGEFLTTDGTNATWAETTPASGAPETASYVTLTTEAGLSGEASLGELTTGLLKNTVAAAVGTLSTAVAKTDYAPAPSGTNALKADGTGGFDTAAIADLTDGTAVVQGATALTNAGYVVVVSTDAGIVEELGTQSANFVFAGPETGADAVPAFRALVSADIPNNGADTTGTSSFVVDISGHASTELSDTAVIVYGGTALTSAGYMVVVGTDSGTVDMLGTQSANFVFSGPTTGADAIPAFRALVDADIPSDMIRGGDALTIERAIPVVSAAGTLAVSTTGWYGPFSLALTDGTAAQLFSFPLADGAMAGGGLTYTIFCENGTGIQSHSGVVSWAATRRGTTYVTAINESSALESAAVTIGTTLTDAWTMTASAGTGAVLVSANTSLDTPLTFNVVYTVVNHGAQALTYPGV